MPRVLITGANRGLGLEFARQYADAGWRVDATCRDPDRAEALADIARTAGGRVAIHRLDVGDWDAIAALAADLGAVALDLLLNNAGVYGSQRKAFGDIDYESWLETLRINALAPMRMAQAFVEHVARSDERRMVFISSKMGSIAENTSGGSYIYRSSKAALNAVVKSLSIDLAGRGIVAVAFHPGWVRTDMGGPRAPLDPPESVAAMRGVIARLGAEDSGRFLNYDGAPIPW